MKIEEILGKREDQRLEFKSAKVLADEPESVARAVVGMLNAGGGEIWIGVDDENDVAVALSPVADPERAKTRLRDFLLETLDPSPIADEVSIDVVPPYADAALLVVRVQPRTKETGRSPYAFKRRGGWHFLRRVGARNHPMSREEIFEVRVSTGEDRVDKTIRKLVAERSTLRDSGQEGLWMGFQPARSLDLETPTNTEHFDQIALDPTITQNRRAGGHFAQSWLHVTLVKDGIRWEARTESLDRSSSSVEVKDNGTLIFWASLWALQTRNQGEFDPWRLLEYPISAFRIARVIYMGHLDPDDAVAVDLALFGVDGWKLRPGTPNDLGFHSQLLHKWKEPDLVWEPLTFTFRQIDEAPDRCGFRLVRRVYQAFGLREDAMPGEYDRETGRLVLPE